MGLELGSRSSGEIDFRFQIEDQKRPDFRLKVADFRISTNTKSTFGGSEICNLKSEIPFYSELFTLHGSLLDLLQQRDLATVICGMLNRARQHKMQSVILAGDGFVQLRFVHRRNHLDQLRVSRSQFL